MTTRNLVYETAISLKLLESGERLKKLDSLTIVDFVLALQQATKIKLPTASLREECFQTLDTVAALLDDFVEDDTC